MVSCLLELKDDMPVHHSMNVLHQYHDLYLIRRHYYASQTCPSISIAELTLQFLADRATSNSVHWAWKTHVWRERHISWPPRKHSITWNVTCAISLFLPPHHSWRLYLMPRRPSYLESIRQEDVPLDSQRQVCFLPGILIGWEVFGVSVSRWIDLSLPYIIIPCRFLKYSQGHPHGRLHKPT